MIMKTLVYNVPAREYTREVVVTVPALGTWVRALGHPVGLLALIGLPFLMLALDLVLLALRRLYPTLRIVAAYDRTATYSAPDALTNDDAEEEVPTKKRNRFIVRRHGYSVS